MGGRKDAASIFILVSVQPRRGELLCGACLRLSIMTGVTLKPHEELEQIQHSRTGRPLDAWKNRGGTFTEVFLHFVTTKVNLLIVRVHVWGLMLRGVFKLKWSVTFFSFVAVLM